MDDDDASMLRHLIRAAELLIEAYGRQRVGVLARAKLDAAFLEACKGLEIDPATVI